MSAVTRHVFRSLAAMRWRSVAIVSTVALAVSTSAGVFDAIRSIFHTQETLEAAAGFADLEVLLVPEDVSNLPDLRGIAGVRAVERRLVFPSVVDLGGGARIAGVLTFLERPDPTVDALRIEAGAALDAGRLDEVVVERSLAQHHGVRPGAALRVEVGERRYDFSVRGVAFSPEYFTVSSNPDYFVPEKGALGVVFANLDVVSGALGFRMVNDLLFLFEPGADPAAAKAAVLARLGPLPVERIVTRESHFSHRFLQMDLASVRRFIPAIVVVLGALGFLLTLLTFDRLVVMERREIGVMLALGWSRGAVLRSYLAGGLVLGAAGCAAGMALSLVDRFVFAFIYSHALGLPEPILRSYPDHAAAACALGIGIAAASAVLPGLRLLYLGRRSGTPQEIIRDPPRSPAAGGLWRFAAALPVRSFAARYAVRNLVRRRGLTVTMVAAMALALAVPIAYGIAVDSIRTTVARGFERERWDVAVDFLYPVFPDEVDLAAGASGARVEPYLRSSVEIATEEGARRGDFRIAGLLGVRPGSPVKELRLVAGRGFGEGPDEEIVIGKDLAERLGAGVGHRVVVKAREELVSLRVAGITSDLLIGQTTVTLARARALLGYEEKMSGAYVSGVADPDAFGRALQGREAVGKVTRRQHMAESFLSLLGEITRLVWVAGVISIVVALLFMFTSLNIGIAEARREYATLKALGFGRGALVRMVLTEAWTTVGLAAALAAPIAAVLARFLTGRMSQAWFQVDLAYGVGAFAVILLPALALVPAWAYPGILSVTELSITEAMATKLAE